MDSAVGRQSLLNQFHSYSAICHNRGLAFELPDEKTISGMSDSDLAQIVRQLRDIARTPGADR